MATAIEAVVRQAMKTFLLSNKDSLKSFNENFSKLLGLVSNITSDDINFEQQLLTQQVQEIRRCQNDQQSIQLQVQYIHRAPVTYIKIFENEIVTLGVFVVREGNKLPLHNHPLMHGIIKVLAGSLKITSYSILDPDEQLDKGGGDPKVPNSGGNHEHVVGEAQSQSERAVDHFLIPGIGLVPIPCYEERNSTDSQDSAYSSQETSPSAPDFLSHSSLSYLESSQVVLASRHPPLVLSSQDGAKYLTPRRRNLHQLHSVDGPAAFLDVIAPPYKPITLLDCTYFEDVGEVSPDRKSIRMLQRIPCPRYFYTDEGNYMGPPIQINTAESR